LYVAQSIELQNVQGHTLGRDHVIAALIRLALAKHQRPNAIRIPKSNDSNTDDQGNHRVAAFTALMNGLDRVENLLGRWATVRPALQFVRKDIEQHFGIGTRAQMAAVFLGKQFCQFVVVGQVAVVTQADAVRRIDIERLCFGCLCTTGCRVTNVANANVTGQAQHVTLVEHVANKAVALALAHAVVAPGNDTCSILAAMLQHGQCVVDTLVNR